MKLCYCIVNNDNPVPYIFKNLTSTPPPPSLPPPPFFVPVCMHVPPLSGPLLSTPLPITNKAVRTLPLAWLGVLDATLCDQVCLRLVGSLQEK